MIDHNRLNKLKSFKMSSETKTHSMNRHSVSGYALANGLNMYYEIHGHGAPLVLIHGGGSTITTSFGRIFPLLAKEFQVIAVELQGHGHTPDREAPESFEQDADDVAALLHSLQISQAYIFGFSNGGNTAIQMAIRHPRLIQKLILASTFYKREGLISGFFDGMEQATLEVMPQALKDAFLEINPDPARLLTMFHKDKERMLRFKDWEDEWLRSIQAPTLIVHGDQDVILPEHAVEMAKLIPHSRLLILPATHGSYMGVAESPQPEEAIFELTVQIMKDFLREA
jgi:pimeloyl-ACP methyl ester carboxylesterase